MELEAASIAEGHVAWVDVYHEHAVTFEKPKNRLHFRPPWAELLLFLAAPIGKHLFGEIGGLVEKGAREIEHERTGNDGHVR